jgi:hypothetical protein
MEVKIMALIKGLLFWGYLDDQGKIHVHRYTNDRKIANIEALPWVKGIFDPFEAYDLKHARELVEERYRKELN